MFEPGDRNELERRIVTVLFCDLAGFTTLSEQLDPDSSACDFSSRTAWPTRASLQR